ncbi:lethal(2) giant larvae protein isoform X2 [Onthophagus taurus]|uniref:lethal(2) giant larvae protein isoform X2 n=1 Tax=Onthophagus taurus TaxID=166361 RepID=UPI000C208558|nr:lethal(2) giant larvae protein isoform X2 [Onthophagus taurus]
MFKFIKAKGPHQTAERQKLQKELFSYRRTLQHGFPHKPTAIAWDPTLRLICIGTSTGAIKVFGKPGVEFYGQHSNSIAVTQLVFLPNVGKVVSLCEDNSLHLWEVDKSSLVEVKTQALEGKLKKISAMCVESTGEALLLGTEGGNIYLLELNTFEMVRDNIYQEDVMQHVPQDYKLNPGAVEAIFEQPGHPNNILIGYNRGLLVLYNRADNVALKTFPSQQQLESLCWHDDGEGFTTSHNDGSYLTWELSDYNDEDNPLPEPTTTYGPFPCKAIPKIIRKELNDQPLIVFSGGLPRASYSDKHTVSVVHDTKHVTFELTSKIIDFLVVESPLQENDEDNEEESEEQSGGPDILLILADEELVAIDLKSEDWKMMNLPYLVSLHASAVICSQHVSNVSEELWVHLKEAGRAQTSHMYSSRSWPIQGGSLLCSKGETPRRELLLTGHEDGTVRFWDAGCVNLTPIYKFSTSQYFTGDDIVDDAVTSPDDSEEEWPPFRKTGIFDPYSDDARLAIKKISLCPLSGTLAVAGTAGHIVLAKFDTEILDGEVKVNVMNIVSDRDGFVWKGHDQLTPKQGNIRQNRGFQANNIVQLYPPAAVTCVVLRPDWGLLAAGTAHGLALFDYQRQKPVIVKCTLNPNDLTGAGDAPISRRKSFKKSLRESFRRLRKGRSTRRTNQTTTTPTTPSSPPQRKPPTTEEGNFSPLDAKPVERQIEARPVDDGMGSIVRCLYFARTFLINVQNTIPTLWAGTNNGTVYVFTIGLPSKRDTDDVICQLGKEIQLKHRAPVIAIAVLDGASKPLPEPLEVEKGLASLPDPTQPHRVVIASEEQFKIFTLPSLKPYCKYKLTAHEGARVRRMSFANFSCTSSDTNVTHTETDLLCLTNLGDCLVLSIPDLKRQLNAAAVRREDINGISSLVFTRDGEALYFHSSSELQRISLSATKITSARCYLSIKDKKVTPIVENDSINGDATGNDGEEESSTPIMNGNAESKESSVVDKAEEVRENGDDTLHNVTVSSSIGDITIDSVKDHIGSGEELASRLSGVAITKTVITTVTTNQSGEVTSNSTTTTTNNVTEAHEN